MSSEQPNAARGTNPLLELIKARLLEFIREPAAIFWVYVFPLILVVALGIAFRSRPVESITVDIQQAPGAEAVLLALTEGRQFDRGAFPDRLELLEVESSENPTIDERFDASVLSEEECRTRLRTGKSDLVVVIRGSTFEYLFDPTRPGSLLARNAVDDQLQRGFGRADVVATTDQEYAEPGGRYIDFLIPGLLGMNLMGGGLWGVGFATVDLRIRKLLKRYLATPMKRSHFLLAMMLSRFIFIVPEVLLILVFARVAFGVVIHGSYLSVAVLVMLGALQFSGIGLLIGSRAQTLETVSGLMNLVMLPMWIASGIFFTVERFPEFTQPVIKLLPLTPLIHSLRSVMLEGASLASLGWDLVAIVGWGIVAFIVALKVFRWS